MVKKWWLWMLFVIGAFQVLPAQNDWSIHFLTDLIQSGNSNPAQVPQGLHVALPGGYLQLHGDPGLQKAFENSGGKRRLVLSQLADYADDGIRMQAQAQIEPLMISYLKNKLSLAAQFEAVGSMVGSTNAESWRLLTKGNAPLVGDTIPLVGSFQSEVYQKLGLSFGYHIPYFSFAVRLNILQGIHYLSSDEITGRVYTDADGYATYFQTDMTLMHAGDMVRYLPASNEYMTDYNQGLIPKVGTNWGASIDIGTKLYLSRIFYIAAAATNLGRIFWKEGAETWTNRQLRTFEGLKIDPPFGTEPIDFPDVADSLKQWTSWQVEAGKFKSKLSPVVQLSMHYTIDEHFKMGLMYAREYEEQTRIPLFGAYFSANVGNVWEIGTFYSTKNDQWLNLGLHSVVSLGPVQIFALTDNALDFLSTAPWHNFHVRGGINLRFNYDEANP